MTASPARLDVLVVGDLNPDLILAGDDLTPRFGQVEQLIDSADLVVGGSAAIVACGAARLGLAAGLCAVVGGDELGSIVRGSVGAAGVDTSSVRVDPAFTTGVSVILASPMGRAILTASGAIGALSADDIRSLPEAPPARHVHVSSVFLLGHELRAALPDLLDRCSAAGVTTSIDPNWDPSGLWDLTGLLERVDLVLPNAAELLAITKAGSLEEAIDGWGYRAQLAVKLGPEGGALRADGQLLRVEAPPAPPPADTVGAGDSFVAGYLSAFLAGRTARESLALAVTAGTLSTRAVGGTAGQPDLSEAERVAVTLLQSS